MKVLRILLGVVVGCYVLYLAALCVFQRSYSYNPGHTYVSLAQAHANKSFKELPVKTQDGLDLKGWYAPATTKPFTIVYFHGSGGSLKRGLQIADPYIASGYGFLLAEYRGYSGLPGKPTEAGLYADARAYIYGLMAQGVRSENIVLFGNSLGTGVATQMAEEFHVGGLILLAPYLSALKMAHIPYLLFPMKYMLLDRFENFRKLPNVHVPVLIVNGANDQIIPPSQGKRLFDLANEPRQFYSLPNHGHDGLFDDFAPIGLDWLSRLPAKN